MSKKKRREKRKKGGEWAKAKGVSSHYNETMHNIEWGVDRDYPVERTVKYQNENVRSAHRTEGNMRMHMTDSTWPSSSPRVKSRKASRVRASKAK
jgi:hypothetical protein